MSFCDSGVHFEKSSFSSSDHTLERKCSKYVNQRNDKVNI